MDDAKMSPLHWRIFLLISAGYFFDVLNFIVMGSLIPDMVNSGFATATQAGWAQSATLVGLFIGSVGQGQFTDRIGRKAVYQFNLLLFGVATLASAFSPNYTWLCIFRFIAGIGLGAEQPLCFAYAGEYAPKRIRGRILAMIHLIGGACVWPIASLFTLVARDALGWRGIWIIIGCGALLFLRCVSACPSPRVGSQPAVRVIARWIFSSGCESRPRRQQPLPPVRRSWRPPIRLASCSGSIGGAWWPA